MLPEKNDIVLRSVRNIPGVKTALVNTLNTYDTSSNADTFIVVKDAVAQIEGGVQIMEARDIILSRRSSPKRPCEALTEKKYTFRVAKGANKIAIAKAVEEIFKVKVQKVNTISMKGHLRRMGRNRGLHFRLEKSGRHPDGGIQDDRVLRRHVLIAAPFPSSSRPGDNHTGAGGTLSGAPGLGRRQTPRKSRN